MLKISCPVQTSSGKQGFKYYNKKPIKKQCKKPIFSVISDPIPAIAEAGVNYSNLLSNPELRNRHTFSIQVVNLLRLLDENSSPEATHA